jgi:hypothetical protein
MKRSTFILMLGLGFSGVSLASEDPEWAKAMEIPCHATLTESECRSHHEMLARLPKGSEREAYLAEHFAMIEDRAKACGCSGAQNAVGMLSYP